jgi:hypothetical protein
MADFFSNLISGIGNAASGLLGGSGVSSASPITGDPNELRKKILSMEEAQKGKTPTMNAGEMKKGGKVSSASSRADGIAQRGKTRGTMC